MGTRGLIARRTEGGEGFEGSYHHWDSYPTGLGETLFERLRGLSTEELQEKVDFLLSHTWSTVNNKDWTMEPGWENGPGPDCYCHGKRSETHRLVSGADASGVGVEYAYVIDPAERKIAILSSYVDGRKMIGLFGSGNPDAEWTQIGVIDLASDDTPDLAAMESDEEEE